MRKIIEVELNNSFLEIGYLSKENKKVYGKEVVERKETGSYYVKTLDREIKGGIFIEDILELVLYCDLNNLFGAKEGERENKVSRKNKKEKNRFNCDWEKVVKLNMSLNSEGKGGNAEERGLLFNKIVNDFTNMESVYKRDIRLYLMCLSRLYHLLKSLEYDCRKLFSVSEEVKVRVDLVFINNIKYMKKLNRSYSFYKDYVMRGIQNVDKNYRSKELIRIGNKRRRLSLILRERMGLRYMSRYAKRYDMFSKGTILDNMVGYYIGGGLKELTEEELKVVYYRVKYLEKIRYERGYNIYKRVVKELMKGGVKERGNYNFGLYLFKVKYFQKLGGLSKGEYVKIKKYKRMKRYKVSKRHKRYNRYKNYSLENYSKRVSSRKGRKKEKKRKRELKEEIRIRRVLKLCRGYWREGTGGMPYTRKGFLRKMEKVKNREEDE